MTRAMTAEACVIRFACGQEYRTNSALQLGIAECVGLPPEWNPENGRIDHPIDLKPGANLIVVKAMDEVGNFNYASISVNAK